MQSDLVFRIHVRIETRRITLLVVRFYGLLCEAKVKGLSSYGTDDVIFKMWFVDVKVVIIDSVQPLKQ